MQKSNINSSEFLYLIECGAFVKIGFTTKTPEKRLKELQNTPVLMPYGLKLLAYLQTDPGVARGLEKVLHAEYDWKRDNGEWFELEDSDIWAILKSIKRFGKVVIKRPLLKRFNSSSEPKIRLFFRYNFGDKATMEELEREFEQEGWWA